MILEIVCGARGGIGKTLVSTMKMVYSVKTRNKKTVAIDWNLNNRDLSKTLYFFDKVDAKKLKDGFIFRQVKVDNTNKKLKLFEPVAPGSLTDRDFWSCMADLYDHIKNETIAIVDTRVDLTRLANSDWDISEIKNTLSKYDRIVINYILGWKYLESEIDELEKAYNWLKKYIDNVEFVFIWNVYEQSRPRKLFWRKFGPSIYGNYEKRLKKSKRWVTLSFDTVIELMRKYAIYKIKNLKGDDIPELWEPFFKELLSRIKENQVIWNWLFIPEKTAMTLTTDVNTVGRRGNIKVIQKAKEKFYAYIKQFEEMRDRVIKLKEKKRSKKSVKKTKKKT